VRITRHRTALALALLLGACSESLTPAERLDEAREQLANGEIRSAIIHVKNALQERPDFVPARVLNGQLHLVTADPATAEKEFAKARALGDASTETQRLLLTSLLQQRKYEEVLQEAKVDADTPATILALVAEANLRLGHVERARRILEQAAERVPDSPEVQLGLAKLEHGVDNKERAQEHLQAALAAAPDDLRTLMFAGDVKLLGGEPETARKYYERALEVAPGHPPALLGMTRACIYMSDPDCAGEPLRELRSVASQYPETQVAAAYVHALKGENDAAMDAARQALSLDSKHAPAQLLLSGLLLQREAYEEAAELIAAFLQRFPDHELAKKRKALIDLKRRDPDAVIASLELIPDEQRDAVSLALLASAYKTKGDNRKSTALVEQAAALDPENSNLQVNLALHRFDSGQEEQALAELERLAKQSQGITEADALLLYKNIQAGRLQEALALTESFQEEVPESGAPLNVRGTIYMSQGRLEDARQEFEAALERDPGHLPAWYNLGTLGLATGDNELAERALAHILEAEPSALRARQLLASLQIRQGRLDDARETLRAAIANHPDQVGPYVLLTTVALQAGDIEEAQSLSAQAIELAPDDTRAKLARARTLIAAGRSGQAITMLEPIVAASPGNVEAAKLLAEQHLAAGENGAARRLVSDLRERFPENASLKLLGARIELADGNADAARIINTQLREDFPNAVTPLIFEGEIAAARAEWSKAVEAFQRALETHASSSTTTKLHQALVRSGREKEADALLDEWLNEHPQDTVVLLARAGHSERVGDAEGAISTYRQVIDVDADNPLALNNIAWLLRDSEPAEALEYAERAFDAAPENPAIQDTYGWLLVRAGRTQQGLRVIRQAAEAQPQDPGVQYHLAVALAESGQRSEAEVLLRRTLREFKAFAERDQAEAYYDSL